LAKTGSARKTAAHSVRRAAGLRLPRLAGPFPVLITHQNYRTHFRIAHTGFLLWNRRVCVGPFLSTSVLWWPFTTRRAC